MLTIRNYKKIRLRHFGDWQIGKVEELKECYAFQIWNTIETNRSITLIILRDSEEIDLEWQESTYKISLVEDGRGNSNVIEDVIYKNTLEDMEEFGEALVHYLNSL